MIYRHKNKRGHRCEAVQFLGPDSVEDIRVTFGIRIKYDPESAALYFQDGQIMERGDYAVASIGGFFVVCKTAEWFEARWLPAYEQGELF